MPARRGTPSAGAASSVAIAVITDAHANSFALEAVLAEIFAETPDLIVNLGDQVWGQTAPAAAYALQVALGAVEVRGNNDEKLTFPGARLSPLDRRVRPRVVERLPRGAAERPAGLPVRAALADGEVPAAHGTPTDPWEPALWSWDGRRAAPHYDAEVMARLGDVGDARVVVVGHSHAGAVRRVNGVLVVNAGPVSWQKEGDPRARWLMLRRRGGRWRAEPRRVAYDWSAAAAAVRASDAVFPLEAEAHLSGTDPSGRP